MSIKILSETPPEDRDTPRVVPGSDREAPKIRQERKGYNEADQNKIYLDERGIFRNSETDEPELVCSQAGRCSAYEECSEMERCYGPGADCPFLNYDE